MTRIFNQTLIGALLATLLCSVSVTSVAAADAGELRQGQQLFQEGKLNQALAILRGFVQQNQNPSDTARALVLISRVFSQQQNYGDAILYLQRIPIADRGPEVDLLLGTSLIQTGQYERGLQYLQGLPGKQLSTADNLKLYQALAVAASADNQFLKTLYYLQQQLIYSPTPAPIYEQAHQILQNQIHDADLSEAAFMWQGTAIGQDAQLQLARRAFVRQQTDLAKDHLRKLFASSVTFPYWQEAEQLQQRANAENWLSRDSIGVLIPLSGRFQSYGELVRKGLELALQEHNKTRLPARFVYRDTAVSGVTSAQLVSRLTDDDKVIAVIGPLLGTAAGDAARRAQREMVPMVTFAQTEGLPEIGNFIFRDTLTAEQQVKRLVHYALAKGDISFSILYPENRLGEKMTQLFTQELQASGGEIVDIVSYPEDSTDFRKQIQKLLWEDREVRIPQVEVGEEEQQEPLELEYPLAPFHALFIPDYAEQISQIAPQLVFYGIKDVTLLGINGWNSSELASQAGRFLKDAVFVDAFYPGSKKPEVRRFMELYRQAYQEEPTILGAQAFDVATLLLQVMDDPAVVNRDDLRKKLAAVKDYRGVTGTSGFDTYGEAIKLLSLLQFSRGRVVETE
ncbi:amino acid/amide ABC transporter substrate-binding protein, HAAT family [Desulfuromusa kysingii]|uniref:Amino acid/amide ABC transporter substrate-binding protein, HAAT family n=1 Tax=Desulfuromusa kysingii TaxID=37625 RepID=A0A1H4E0T5_9BACT|nr:penicillin-binding protein activator [Desulfuromusa kysingii]SEA78022.1 amino acid/amide ABC transporter substrate-binding protein, HAAT family [Desulfuromusa kysingii]